MNHYLLTARTITHAQRMARALEHTGVSAKIRRIGSGVTKNGCGYTLQVPERQYQTAADALRTAGLRPVKAFHVVNGERREVDL
ncbi:MAG: DUF3343 domain-containing protein [Oscillospiraceae bacterium]|nr:DUF3343 domain-containing protein [Oscillospiraceae bacterium]